MGFLKNSENTVLDVLNDPVNTTALHKPWITFVGDIHGNFNYLDEVQKQEGSKLLIQCGDFGIWPRTMYETVYKVPVYFCAGNHDWYDYLDIYKSKSGWEGVYLPNLDPYTSADNTNLQYIQTGNVVNIEGIYQEDKKYHRQDEIHILFFGGAMSVDKNYRTPYKSWWPNEEMDDEQFDVVLEHIKKIDREFGIDIVVSHDAPLSYIKENEKQLMLRNPFSVEHKPTRTQQQLEEISKILRKCFLWVHGHYHVDNDVVASDGRRYVALGIPFDIWYKGYKTFSEQDMRDEQSRYDNYLAQREQDTKDTTTTNTNDTIKESVSQEE